MATNGHKWTHPVWGTFTLDHDVFWEGRFKLPAFNHYNFSWGGRGSAGPAGLVFVVEDPQGGEPTEDMIALMAKVIANQDKLASLIPQALWDDFTGKGRHTAWWSNALDEVREQTDYFENIPALTGPDKLPAFLSGPSITVNQDHQGLAEISLGASFEDEHGIGILTDGETIRGIGFSADVMPFDD